MPASCNAAMAPTMIRDRPEILLADNNYTTRPPLPYRIDWSPVPDLIRQSTADLGGVQPVTGAMIKAAAGDLRDEPSEGELSLFRQTNTQFQVISVVASLVAIGQEEGHLVTTPFALNLVPARKRGQIETASVDAVQAVNVSRIIREADAFYTGFDPFTGDCGLYGLNAHGLVPGPGFLDEIGFVIDAFYLACPYDPDDVLAPDIGFPVGPAFERYARYRRDLLFKPFKKVEVRPVWGARSPIEMFLIQELARRGVHPELQILVMDDGATFPSFYHLWGDPEFRSATGVLTEADLYFPDERVAVFCDGRSYHRGKKKRAKDEAINQKLRDLGITPIRITGRQIVLNLDQAADRVTETLMRCA